MGVKGLYTYMKPYRRSIIPDMCEPIRIGIDAMSLIYKYKSEYKQLYPYIQILKDKGHLMIFVFDGKAPVEKNEATNDRRDAREVAVSQAGVLKGCLDDPNLTIKEREVLEYSVARLEYQGWHMTRDIRLEIQEELDKMGIPWIKAIEEADGVLIDMNAMGVIDAVMSTDMDFILAGIKRLWIPARDSYEEVFLDELIEGEGVTPAGILDAGILCGVEPLHSMISVAPKVAFGWIRHYGSLERFMERRDDDVYNVIRDPVELQRVRNHFAAASPPRVREEWRHALDAFIRVAQP